MLMHTNDTNKKCISFFLRVLLITVLLVLSGVVLSGGIIFSAKAGEQGVTLETNIQTIFTFSIDSNTLDLGDLVPGIPVSGTSVLGVETNNETGFNIIVARNDSDTTLDLGTDDTVNITDQADWNSNNPNAVIKDSLDNSGDVFAFRVKETGTDSGNYNSIWWGDTDGDSDALFAGIPYPAKTIINRTSVSSPLTDSIVEYYLDVSANQETGAYDGGVTYTATAN